MPKRTRPYRESLLEDLQSPKEAVQYLNAAMEDSPEMFLIALKDVAEARDIPKVAACVNNCVYRAYPPCVAAELNVG